MRSEDGALGENLLSYYGVPLAEYYGDGVLTLKGGKTAKCRFEAGQLTSGEVLLLCDFVAPFPCPVSISAERFEGTTSKDFRIRADKGIHETSYLPDTRNHRSSGVWAAFRLAGMDVRTAQADRARSARFGVTNFNFIGTERRGFGDCWRLILPLTLQWASRTTQLSVWPVEQYDRVMGRVRTLRSIDVTCEVVGDIPEDGPIERLQEVLHHLCYLLSVARGTKIQWVYCDQYNGAGERTMRTHCSRITKPYCPLAVIDPRAEWAPETKAFVEQAYGSYRDRRAPYKLDTGLIDAYLDAKAENDYLEERGIKLAVAIEALKSLFLEAPDSGATGYVVQQACFEALVPSVSHALDDALRSQSVCRSHRQAICGKGKIRGLNRRAFSDVLNKLCKHIGLTASAPDVKLFIHSRNSLIHTGRFYCTMATSDERKECKPLATRADEYFFLVNFVDKMFLKLLAYGGPYVDRRKPGRPVRTERV